MISKRIGSDDPPSDVNRVGPTDAASRSDVAAGGRPLDAVVFLHLPKCGGTSLHRWMTEVLAPGVLSPERNRMPLEIDPERQADIDRHLVFSGHFDVVDLKRFPTPQRRFTVFRDPVETMVSLYDFWRAHDDAMIEENDLVGPRLASRMTFEEFVGDVDPRIRHDLDNPMVRTFTGLIRTQEPFANPARALTEAIDVVESFDHIGHVASLHDTYVWLCDQFGLDHAAADTAKQHNVRGEWTEAHLSNVERTVVTPAGRAALEPLVYLDRQLVAHFTPTAALH